MHHRYAPEALTVLDSATKYPSIPTYHATHVDGTHVEGSAMDFGRAALLSGGPGRGIVIGREKIDGTNTRILLFPDGTWLIGSRELLLHAKGDRVHNPVNGIVDTLRPLAESLAHTSPPEAAIRVYYIEVYGGRKITAASDQYTGRDTVGHRLFDIVEIPLDDPVLDKDVADVAAWRESGGQAFHADDQLVHAGIHAGIELAPELFRIDATELPTDIDGTLALLRRHAPATRVSLDDGAKGQAEGVVLRTPGREFVAKIKHRQYERTVRLSSRPTTT